MKTCTAIAVAAVLWIYAAQSGPERTDGPIEAAAAADTTVAESKPRQSLSGHTAEDTWAQRQREQRVLAMTQVDRNAILWGNESKPNGSIVLKLDPPLEKTKGSNVIEVELFSAFVDDDGLTQSDCLARELALGVWWPSIENAEVPISLDYRLVTQGPGLDSSYHESRRRIVELVVGGSWYASNGDERGTEVVNLAIRRITTADVLVQIDETDIMRIVTDAGIDPAKWRKETGAEVEKARAHDNARWEQFGSQAVKWSRNTRLGTGASPILVIDGKYLVTMNTIWRQGGLKGTERLFQTVNRLIQQQLEGSRSQQRGAGTTDNQEEKMNYTAAALAAATAFLVACVPTTELAEDGTWMGGWRTESGLADVLPDGAHVQMKDSGKVFRIVGLKPLEGEQGRKAQSFLGEVVKGRKVRCKYPWARSAATQNHPAVVTEEGHPLAACNVNTNAWTRCKSLDCYLSFKALAAGYGKVKLGPWQQRTGNGASVSSKMVQTQNRARSEGKGFWE